MVVGNPSNLTAQEDAKKALMESWDFTVNLIDESDSQANFDAADRRERCRLHPAGHYLPRIWEPSSPTRRSASSTKKGSRSTSWVWQQDKLFKSRHEIDVVDNSHYITQPFARAC